jgi:hypothetical protein
MSYSWANFEYKLKILVGQMREQGVKRIGGIGFGFGAWVLSYASVLCKDMMGAVMCFPLASTIEELYGGDSFILAGRMGCPILFLLSQSCGDTYQPNGEIFEAVKQKHPSTDLEHFTSMPYGWVIRGDGTSSGIMEGIESAIILAQKFIRKKTWPLPLGADINSLRQACLDGDSDMLEQLLKLQVPIHGKDAIDVCGLSPIHYAANAGNALPIKILVSAEADINVTGGARNETALHCAANKGRQKATAMLLHLKADIHAKDKGEMTPLHYSAWKGHSAVCKLLIKDSASPDATDTAGQVPLHLAAWHSRVDTVSYFIKLKCRIDTEDSRGQRPHQRAVQAGAMEIADMLDMEREKREAEAKQEQLRLEAEQALNADQADPDGEQVEGGGTATSQPGQPGAKPKPKPNAAKSKLAFMVGGAK